MSVPINLNTAAFSEQAKALGDALDAFEGFTSNYARNAEGYLAGFNSDFNTSFLHILKNIGDSTGRSLVSEIRIYQQKVQALADEFDRVDDEIAQGISRM